MPYSDKKLFQNWNSGGFLPSPFDPICFDWGRPPAKPRPPAIFSLHLLWFGHPLLKSRGSKGWDTQFSYSISNSMYSIVGASVPIEADVAEPALLAALRAAAQTKFDPTTRLELITDEGKSRCVSSPKSVSTMTISIHPILIY